MKVLFSLNFLAICFVSCQFCEKESISCSSGSTIVQTKLGSISGYTETVDGHDLSVFKGIPFAQPPINSLRFLDPVPITEPWTEPRNATTYSNICPGTGHKNYHEDCLYLNIWSPSGGQTPKPVMVFVHGGSFNFGSGSGKSGAALASKGDVVVVSFNYRLGFFGFFYSEQTKDQGSNMGMKDQLLALKWVKENIEHFNGNPDEVTLFGHSAGGISVGMHLLTSASTPFFKRAIIESGTPYSFLRPDTLEVASSKTLKLSQYLKCSSEDDTSITSKALECLRKVQAKEILVYGSEKPMHSLILPNPVYGDDFYPERADKVLGQSLAEQNIPVKDVIIGFEADEGESFVRRKLDFSVKYDTNITYNSVIDHNRNLYEGKLSEREQSLLNSHFFKESDSREELVKKLYQAYGELYVYCPSYFFAKSYASQSLPKKTFMYLLNVKCSRPDISNCKGVCHGEELPLVFGQPFLQPEKYSDTDRKTSGKVIEYWSAFAKGQSLEWSTFKQDQEIYNSIHELGLEKKDEKFENCEKFWRQIFSSH